jgi:hypothetical protein
MFMPIIFGCRVPLKTTVPVPIEFSPVFWFSRFFLMTRTPRLFRTPPLFRMKWSLEVTVVPALTLNVVPPDMAVCPKEAELLKSKSRIDRLPLKVKRLFIKCG